MKATAASFGSTCQSPSSPRSCWPRWRAWPSDPNPWLANASAARPPRPLTDFACQRGGGAAAGRSGGSVTGSPSPLPGGLKRRRGGPLQDLPSAFGSGPLSLTPRSVADAAIADDVAVGQTGSFGSVSVEDKGRGHRLRAYRSGMSTRIGLVHRGTRRLVEQCYRERERAGISGDARPERHLARPVRSHDAGPGATVGTQARGRE